MSPSAPIYRCTATSQSTLRNHACPAAQLGNLSSLRHLSLFGCGFSEASLRQLAALPLQDLDVVNSTLPPCLSQLTCLTSLAVGGLLQDTDAQALDAALPCLVLLRRMVLSHPAAVPVPSGLTALRSLRRVYIQAAQTSVDVAQEVLPGGPWLASLEWLVSAQCAPMGSVRLQPGACNPLR